MLDDYGGTEVVPVYPGEMKFLQGAEYLKCNRISSDGTNRWSTTCCNSPIVNTPDGMPWAGVFHQTYTRTESDYLEKLGKVKSRIYGKYAREGAPFKISAKIGFGDMVAVMPFIVKGKMLKKHLNSPFFESDNATLIREPEVL